MNKVQLTAAKKVVIITEAAIEEQVISLLNACGAKGYTVYRELAGKGVRRIRSGLRTWQGQFAMNVRIETVLVGEEQALYVMEEVYNKFLAEKYAGIIYLEDVRVIRTWKF